MLVEVLLNMLEELNCWDNRMQLSSNDMLVFCCEATRIWKSISKTLLAYIRYSSCFRLTQKRLPCSSEINIGDLVDVLVALFRNLGTNVVSFSSRWKWNSIYWNLSLALSLNHMCFTLPRVVPLTGRQDSTCQLSDHNHSGRASCDISTSIHVLAKSSCFECKWRRRPDHDSFKFHLLATLHPWIIQLGTHARPC